MENVENGSVYRSPRCGAEVHVWHGDETVELIVETARQHAPHTVVELGTYKGGLTLALHDALPRAWIYSFDAVNTPGAGHDRVSFYPASCRRAWFGPRVSFHRLDVCESESKLIRRLLSSKKRKLLYCDNGDKVVEVNVYAPYLRPGDLLGVHDWGTEIREENVTETLKAFRPHRHGLFEKAGSLARFWIRKVVNGPISCDR